MKKTLIRSFSLSTALVLCGSSFASEQKMVTTYGMMQVRAYTSDSQRSNTPDFFVNKLRLGVNVNEGHMVNAKVQIQYQGWPGVSSQNSAMMAPSVQGPVYVREARLNFVPVNIMDGENSFKTTLALGGIHLGGADSTAPDIASFLSAFDRMDGVYLSEDMMFGKMVSVQIGVG
ncbi:MAG: hypothetical protein K2X39_10110, partial [Silvanigrellaceae bacterium]|nr:hypothetical protein [Silvanigrellaceae bacterium]